MTIAVRAILLATFEIGVVGAGHAIVLEILVTLSSGRLVNSTREAVIRLAGTRADIKGDVSKNTVTDTITGAVNRARQTTKVLRREDSRLGKLPGILSLVPPDKGTVKAALFSKDLLERLEKVAVP